MVDDGGGAMAAGGDAGGEPGAVGQLALAEAELLAVDAARHQDAVDAGGALSGAGWTLF